MAGRDHPLRQRVESLRFRIHSLSSLRRLVALPPGCDVSERQWALLEPQLAAASGRLANRVRRAADWALPRIHEPRAARQLNAVLGEVELDLSRAFTFFDTYMDVLTQRRSPELGAVLAGCDVLAAEEAAEMPDQGEDDRPLHPEVAEPDRGAALVEDGDLPQRGREQIVHGPHCNRPSLSLE